MPYRPWDSSLTRYMPLRNKGRLNQRNEERMQRRWEKAYHSEERVLDEMAP